MNNKFAFWGNSLWTPDTKASQNMSLKISPACHGNRMLAFMPISITLRTIGSFYQMAVALVRKSFRCPRLQCWANSEKLCWGKGLNCTKCHRNMVSILNSVFFPSETNPGLKRFVEFFLEIYLIWCDPWVCLTIHVYRTPGRCPQNPEEGIKRNWSYSQMWSTVWVLGDWTQVLCNSSWCF